MITILHDKDDKKLAIKVAQKLETSGFKCSLDPLEQNSSTTEKTEIVVLIFSQKNNSSIKIINETEKVFENEIPIIPFIISDIEHTVAMKHFLNSHDWINAFDINTNESLNDLVLLISETLTPNKQLQTKKHEKNTSKIVTSNTATEPKKMSNQTFALIAISLIFIVILGFLIFGKNKVEKLNNVIPPADELIIGKWKLAEYQDNMQRNATDYADFISSVTLLKKNFLLVLSKNGTFEKYGFAQIEKGSWQFDKQNKILYMWPPDSELQKDMLSIDKLTQDSMIMRIATQIDNETQVITKFTLYREK